MVRHSQELAIADRKMIVTLASNTEIPDPILRKEVEQNRVDSSRIDRVAPSTDRPSTNAYGSIDRNRVWIGLKETSADRSSSINY